MALNLFSDTDSIDNKQLKANIITGAAVGLIFPVVAWIVDFLSKDIPLSLKGLWQMHLENPLLFFIDLAPLVLAYLVYYLMQQRGKFAEKFEKEIQRKDERIEKNAVFAKRIGEGNFKTEFEVEDEDDVLGRSLILMRDNLLRNTQKESDQNWIAEGKDLISGILRMHNSIEELSTDVIINLIKYIQAIQGALYLYDEEQKKLVNLSTYAYDRKKYINQEFSIGEGLIGQCAYEMDIIYRTEVPDNYVTITSGILGDKKPASILIVPLIADEKLQGVIEFASLEPEIPELSIRFLEELGEIIARTIFNLSVNEKTENLLRESQKMTQELQENEEQLRQNAEEMRATQEELQKSNEKLESQILAVENAQKKLHSLLENASEIISIYDQDLKPSFISPSVTTILGFTPDEMIKGKDMDRLTRKGEMEMREMFNNLLEKPQDAITIQYTFMKKDGEKIFLETTGRNLLHDKAIQGIILNSQDITERKRAEKEERMRSKMQALSENSLDLILRISTTGHIFYANPVVEDYTGIQSKDVINKTFHEAGISEVLQEYFKSAITEMKKTPKKTNGEIKIALKMGEKEVERVMSIDAIPEFNENELETVLFVGHDITEAKRIEKEIQDKNRKIEDSINYAERIQTSILPDNKFIRETLPKSFIFYRPRDVVSGDFPWFFQKGDNIYIAAVDCTGHGVPGALLSFIGYFILNNVVDHDIDYKAATVCDELHYGVRRTLKQDRDDANARDGMDIALCKINMKKKELQYAGAHRPLYLLRNGELIEYKGDRKAIGGIPLGKKKEKDFTNYVINFVKGDKVFFFSDGLPDQLGGPELKKYSPRRIRENIIGNPSYSMQEYYSFFAEDFKTWKGDHKQIDDVLLIGIEF